MLKIKCNCGRILKFDKSIKCGYGNHLENMEYVENGRTR